MMIDDDEYRKIKLERDELIKARLALETQLNELLNEKRIEEKQIEVLIHNRDVALDCTREILKINEELRETIHNLRLKENRDYEDDFGVGLIT